MADYYSILKKTLSGLPKNTEENRRIVYGKARQAIDRQLRALQPTPSEEAIARQMKLLEQAIGTVEAEFSGSPAQAAPARPPSAAPSGAPRPNVQAPAPRAPVAPTQTPQQRPAPRPPEARAAPPASPAPRPQMPPQSAGAQARPASQTSASQAPTPSAQRGAPAASASAQGHPQGGTPRGPGAGSPGAARTAPSGGGASPAYDAMLDELDEYDRAPQGRQRVSALGKEKRRGGWFVTLLVTLVILAILAAGGFALWHNKDALITALGIEDIFAPGQTSDEKAARNADDQSAAPAGEGQSDEGAIDGKEDVRLNQSGDTVPGQENEEATSQPVREAGRLSNTPDEQPAPQQDSAATEQQPVQVNPVGQDGDVQNGGTQEQAGAAEETQGAANESLPPPAIAQKAYLYEEGGAGSGATRDNAAIVWSLEEQPPADGMPPEAVVHGQFDVPGRGLVMQLTIRRNVDEALPASHIIELRFETPADFSGGEIDNVARFVMKSSEQARGEGLIAVPAKIDTGYFLIALNNLAQAQETNRKLLTESSWIDIPIGYTSGRRALVTLEKGAIGEKVFKDAFADWDTR